MAETKKIKITIKELIGSDSAISTEDGDKLFQRIDKALKNNALVQISFKDIKLITTAFLNAGIGQLYGGYEGDELNKKLEILEIGSTDLEVLKKVIEAAKKYFNNQKEVDDSVTKVLEDDN